MPSKEGPKIKRFESYLVFIAVTVLLMRMLYACKMHDLCHMHICACIQLAPCLYMPVHACTGMYMHKMHVMTSKMPVKCL